MIFDVDAVKQLVRQYNGFYLVKGGSGGGVLQYKSDAHCCSIHVDCGSGEVRVTLQEEYRGKQSVAKRFPDYNSIHEVRLSLSWCCSNMRSCHVLCLDTQ